VSLSCLSLKILLILDICTDPHTLLLTPHSKDLEVTPQLRRKIVRYLTTAFGVHSHEAEDLIPDRLEQWGRLRIANGGDEVQARKYHKLRPDGRDAAYVRVSTINACIDFDSQYLAV
jgi:alkylhydroperoxidase family enzyme